MQGAGTLDGLCPPGFAEGRHALGIDVGGTKIAGAIVNLATGAIAARRQIPTDCHRGGEPVLEDVARLARTLMADANRMQVEPLALGVGVAELVGPTGQVFSDYRIKWKGIDIQDRLRAFLSNRARTEVTVSSDVRAAALAEARFGSGRGGSDFFYLTIGTGVSGVLVQNGVPYAGSRGAALVIANGPTLTHCAHCGHMTSHVVEDIASGPGLAAAYAFGCRAEDVLAAAHAGDARAVAVINHATHELGRVVALLVNSLDPATVVIGGGLGCAPGRYFDTLTKAIHAGLWDADVHDLPVLQSTLGRDAGIIGAAATSTEKEPANRPHQST